MDRVDGGRRTEDALEEGARVEAYSRRVRRGAEALRESLKALDEGRRRPVGRLEDSLLGSLTALREGFPDLERHMFVFPVSLVAPGSEALEAARAVVRSDEVVLLCREADRGPGERLRCPGRSPQGSSPTRQ